MLTVRVALAKYITVIYCWTSSLSEIQWVLEARPSELTPKHGCYSGHLTESLNPLLLYEVSWELHPSWFFKIQFKIDPSDCCKLAGFVMVQTKLMALGCRPYFLTVDAAMAQAVQSTLSLHARRWFFDLWSRGSVEQWAGNCLYLPVWCQLQSFCLKNCLVLILGGQGRAGLAASGVSWTPTPMSGGGWDIVSAQLMLVVIIIIIFVPLLLLSFCSL